MKNDEESSQLDNQPVDYVASAVKSIVGAAPFAGSLLVELAGVIIPNQRIDRITKFIKILEEKFSKLEKDFIRSQLTNEHFTDLLEEGALQAAHSLSDERREYLASLITNSLSLTDIEFNESKHLLRILGELNDVEIIWLTYFGSMELGLQDSFQQMHSSVLEPVMATINSPQWEVGKQALQDSYKDHLLRLGLIEPRYDIDSKTRMTKFDKYTGALKVRSHQITSMERLLLRQIGLGGYVD
jgi:hypothetical protein